MSSLFYTSADTAAYQQFLGGRSTTLTRNTRMSYAGAMFAGHGPYVLLFGGDPHGETDGTFSTYLRLGDAAATELYGDSTLKESDWYQFKLTMNFSVPGCAATLSYKDLTAGDPGFTQDGTLVNKNLG